MWGRLLKKLWINFREIFERVGLEIRETIRFGHDLNLNVIVCNYVVLSLLTRFQHYNTGDFSVEQRSAWFQYSLTLQNIMFELSECYLIHVIILLLTSYWNVQEFYLDLRKNHQTADSTPITTRQLESLIRLTEVFRLLWT